MNCRDAQRLLSAERDDALPAEQRAALAEHIAGCADCEQHRATFAAAVDSWRRSVSAVDVPDAQLEWQRLRRVVSGNEHTTAASRGRNFLAWFAAPLAAAAAIALVFLPDRSAPETNSALAPREIARAEYVEAANASTTVFVDEKSGWLVVLASDTGASRI